MRGAGQQPGCMGINPRQVHERLSCWVLTLAIVVIIAARCPEILYQPRFWAEEGTIFFVSAWERFFFGNIFTAHYGYYTLYNSLATSLAVMFPLESAPLVTTWLAFALQVLTSLMVIWGSYSSLPTVLQRGAVAVAIQLLAYTGIWLNTIGVQYFFCVMTCLVLLHDEEARTPAVQRFHYGLLVLTGFTGVLSGCMLPAFLVKYRQTRARFLVVCAGILGSSLIVQVVVFFSALFRKDPEVAFRFVGNDPARLLLKTVSFQFAAPFFGHLALTTPTMEEIGFTIRTVVFSLTGFDNFRTDSQVVTAVVGTVVFVVLLVLFYRRRQDLDSRLLFLLCAVLIPISTLLSIQMSSGPRYTYAPGIFLILFLASLAGDRRDVREIRIVAGLLVVLALTFNGYEYRRSMLESAYNPAWLPWKEEVRKWRQYPIYDPAIWPPPWRMHLNK